MPYHPVVNEAGLIETRPVDPAEKFVNAEGSNVSESKILDYWVWAFSDLVGNTERGHLAEYLYPWPSVPKALYATTGPPTT